MYIHNIHQIRNENEKERDFVKIQELAKTEQKEELKKAIRKNMQYYSTYIIQQQQQYGRALDQSIRLTNALISVDVKSEESVSNVFQIARIVAPEKERAYFRRSREKDDSDSNNGSSSTVVVVDPLPEHLWGLLQRRANYLLSASQPETHTDSAAANDCNGLGRNIKEIVLLWQQFTDICAACECGAFGEKYMRLSNQFVLSVLSKMMANWDDGSEMEDQEERSLNDLIELAKIKPNQRQQQRQTNTRSRSVGHAAADQLRGIWHKVMLFSSKHS